MGIRDIIVIGAFVASAPVCFFRPFYGVLLWTIVAFLNPHRFAWEASQTFPLALIIAIPTLAGALIFSRDWKNIRSREIVMIMVLQVWFTVTSFAAQHNPLFVHHIADTWDRWEFVTKVLVMTVVSAALVNTWARLRLFVLAIAGSFAILVVKAIPFLITTKLQFRLFGPEGSMIADNNDFGLALNMTLPLFFFLARTESERWVRRLFAFLFVITIPAIFCTYSRGALLGLIVVSTLMFMQLKERWLLLPVGGLALVIALAVAPATWKERMNPTREGAVDGSAQGRLHAWKYATNLALDYPITGGGFATFTRELYERYGPPGSVLIGAHSVYFSLLAEHGFVGLGLYLLMVVFSLSSTWQLARWAKYYGDTTVLNYTNMFRFSLCAFLVSGTFLGRAYFDYFFAIVACLAILRRVAFESWAEMENDEEDQESRDWSVSHAV